MLRPSITVCSSLLLAFVAACSSSGSDEPAGRGGSGATGGTSSGAAGKTGTGGTESSVGTAGTVGTAGSSVGGTSSGTAGSVGNAGTGGSAGGAPGTAGAGVGAAGTGGGSTTTAVFSDDFESGTVGAAPDATKWIPTKFTDCDSQATNKPVIDDSQHHSGAHSLKIAGVTNFCDYVMVGNQSAFQSIGNVVYGRYYVRFETALSMAHVGFTVFTDQTASNALRLGGQSGALEWNRQMGDATLPSQSPAGIAMSKVPPVGTWMCLEFMIDQTQGLINTWVDGTLVPGLVADATPTADVDQTWGQSYRPMLTSFNIGWQDYGGSAMNLWFDDVALSSTRIGCN